MAHFAQINDQNEVIQVIVVADGELLDEHGNESEALGRRFCKQLLGGNWVQTSYNGRIRARYAAIGGTYDPVNDVFINPKPYPSWVLDGKTFEWIAPKPVPDAEFYYWDEAKGDWIIEDSN